MIFAIAAVLAAIAAYLLGSISTSIIVTKILTGKDIRTIGSGNAGATNALRATGKLGALYVLLGDFSKAAVAVLFAKLLGYLFHLPVHLADITVYIASLAVVLGHNFPLYYGFKGGKGIATSGIIILLIDWRIGLAVVALAILVMALTRYVSLGSICAAIAFPVLIAIFRHDSAALVIFSILLGALAVYMHRANIKRLLNGTENKLRGKKES